ncbi:MAG: InlB B-repeat-containing protein [Alphaproteobacteria bacterium]|nr:InlB B-repeat-containing protein [Alphaproteobacteria bacterium]
MRKFISIIFIFVFCSNVVLAAITCTQSATTECEVGCYVSSTLGCTSCNNGYYTDTTGQLECRQCNKPSNASFTSPGTNINDCTWTITCPAGTRFVNKGNSSSGCFKPTGSNYFFPKAHTKSGTGFGVSEGGDYECGQNSKVNQEYTGCICDAGYHLPGMEDDDTDTTANNVNLSTVLNQDNEVECIPNDYTITYDPNNNKDSKKTRNVEFNQVIDLSEQIKDLYNPIPTKEGYSLSSWKYKEDTYAADAQFTYLYTDDITLTAQWSGKKFTITYNTGNAECSLSTPQNCTYGGTCNSQRVDSCKYSGYLFKGWKCTSGCTDSSSIINMDTNVSTLSDGNDMTLTAQWQQCTAGYYCESVLKQDACPAGSTSAAGSTAQTACYMSGGTTKICDNTNNCFTLPGSSKIYYHGGTQ